MTKFKIEGGSMVKGVTQFIMTFSTFLTQNKKYANEVDNKVELVQNN